MLSASTGFNSPHYSLYIFSLYLWTLPKQQFLSPCSWKILSELFWKCIYIYVYVYAAFLMSLLLILRLSLKPGSWLSFFVFVYFLFVCIGDCMKAFFSLFRSIIRSQSICSKKSSSKLKFRPFVGFNKYLNSTCSYDNCEVLFSNK